MINQRKIILASTSKARKKLLEQTELIFSTEASDYEENLSLEVAPSELVKILSQGKANAVARKHKDAIIIGADSVGVLGKKILGKPQDESDARTMLRSMSGKSHKFISGLTVMDTKLGKEVTISAETKVYFKELTKKDIYDYVASGEPMSCAASYAIQGLGAVLVQKIEGEYSNIMGIPLSKLSTILQEFGIRMLSNERDQTQVSTGSHQTPLNLTNL